MNLFPVIKKYFLSRTFEESGFVYHFFSVLERDDSIVKGDVGFIVDVKLPMPGQSYCTEKFNDDILNFVGNFQKYLGENFSYSLNLLIEGNGDAPDLYISPEKQDELIEKVNEIHSFEMGDYQGKFKWYRPEDELYEMDQENIMINLNLDLFDVTQNSKPIDTHEVPLRHTSLQIWELISDNYDLRNNLEGIIIDVLESEVSYSLQKIEGIKV
jgi:hypothetical protein